MKVLKEKKKELNSQIEEAQKERLYKAVAESGRSIEEILEMLSTFICSLHSAMSFSTASSCSSNVRLFCFLRLPAIARPPIKNIIHDADEYEADEEYALLCLQEIKRQNPRFYVGAFSRLGEV